MEFWPERIHVWMRLQNTGEKFQSNTLQRLPITRDLSPSKESDKVAFWWTSIKGKPLEIILILTTIQGSRIKQLKVLSADS